jgi:pimeloyl-ACP methyl ester carboxylesterase
MPPSIIKTSVGNVEVWKKQTKLSSRNSVYFIPGFPGSSLENASLGRELLRQGYAVHLINPPGHGQAGTGNKNWRYRFPQYGRALFDSIKTDSSSTKNPIIIAHSAGAEMVMQWLLLHAQNGDLPKHTRIVFINPWLPSISNAPITWTQEDDDLLDYSPWLVKFFGPFSKNSVHKRLFTNPKQKHNADYIEAHEELSEDLGGWGAFDYRFVNLIRGTTRTQRSILQQSAAYELSGRKLALLNKFLLSANVNLLVISSSGTHDKIIPRSYRESLKKALHSKLPTVKINFSDIAKGGHILQVEQPKQVLSAIGSFLRKIH